MQSLSRSWWQPEGGGEETPSPLHLHLSGSLKIRLFQSKCRHLAYCPFSLLCLCVFSLELKWCSKCLLCSSHKQQNTAVVQLAYVRIILNYVVVESSFYLFWSMFKFNSVSTYLMLNWITECIYMRTNSVLSLPESRIPPARHRASSPRLKEVKSSWRPQKQGSFPILYSSACAVNLLEPQNLSILSKHGPPGSSFPHPRPLLDSRGQWSLDLKFWKVRGSSEKSLPHQAVSTPALDYPPAPPPAALCFAIHRLRCHGSPVMP